MRSTLFLVAFTTALTAGSGSFAADHDNHQHMHGDGMAATETRQMVEFPEALRVQTMAHMRDHLLALAEIQEALAQGQFDRAGDIAENRLGMSSMPLHGAEQVARYMPESMRSIGSAMHHAASRLALAAKDAAVTNDLRPPLAALSDLSRQCIACHAAYRAH